ncbi:MAG: hypothetical protein FI717_05180 [SAR202 cluster bacterium]|nr:hypothetical protein [Chloroflexota bacterium]MBO19971.1 hypothetical protein [Chloroflexota bacterium]MQG33680.1 hypothetical protein [SAR202 cluster bacterium]HCL26360.1 hypothetical protein [Dehalococcoidia bacterium]HCP24283.1 hypothetical protein [Dehalococcoidia bacterium]|tara:strand:+ start:416 stop:784 length:369 start_codon:yes stop_codon:yes gene_type:complete
MPKFVHVYTGPEGVSVIEEKEFEMQPFTDTEGAHGLASATQQTPGISFRMIKAGYFLDFHTAPRRQYSISLTGSVELGLPDGTLKQYGPGTVLLAEDMTGTGHSTRVIGDEDRFTIVIPLSD